MSRAVRGTSVVLLVALLAAFGSTQVSADVRLIAGKGKGTKEQPPSVQVVPSMRGPWSVVGRPKLVLNPQGDTLGDGFPGVGVRPAGAVVAWVRSLDGRILVAGSDRSAWRWSAASPAPDAIGVPVVAWHHVAATVAWQEAQSGSAAVSAVAVIDGEMTSPERVLDGWLADVGKLGDAQVFLGLGSDGIVTVTAVSPRRTLLGALALGRLYPPEEILTMAATGGPGRVGVPGPIDPLGGIVSALSSPLAANPGTLTPAPTPELHVITRRGEDVAVATAWMATNELAFIEVHATGPVGTAETLTAAAGSVEYPDLLVTQALAEVMSR